MKIVNVEMQKIALAAFIIGAFSLNPLARAEDPVTEDDGLIGSSRDGISLADMKNVAAFYASKKPVPGAAKNKDTLALGEKIYRGGIADRKVPACAGCHGPNGQGNPSAGFPSLHGQYAAYLEKTLADFKSGERANDANNMMRQIASHLSEEDMSALADYASTLK